MQRISLRLFTVTAIVGLSVFASTRGFEIVEFAQARAAGQHANADAVGRWIGIPGLSYAALVGSARAGSARAGDTESAGKRTQMLIRMLSVRPLSSNDWLSLAGIRMVTAAPRAETLGALKMSSITGPNEGVVMWQRGVFGLLQWESLPADARERTIADLAGVIVDGVPEDGEISEARMVASMKSPAARSEIGSKLIGATVPPTVVTQMGL